MPPDAPRNRADPEAPRRGGADWDRWTAGPVRRGIHRDGWDAATRKPRLLFRFSGAFLLRFAGRQFLAWLRQRQLAVRPAFVNATKAVARHCNSGEPRLPRWCSRTSRLSCRWNRIRLRRLRVVWLG